MKVVLLFFGALVIAAAQQPPGYVLKKIGFALTNDRPYYRVCSRIGSGIVTVSYSVASQYSVGYSCGFWDRSRCTRYGLYYHTRYQHQTVYHTVQKCCYGYHDPGGGINCVCKRVHYRFPAVLTDLVVHYTVICDPPCEQGVCNFGTESCDCYPGYTGGACQDGKQFIVFGWP